MSMRENDRKATLKSPFWKYVLHIPNFTGVIKIAAKPVDCILKGILLHTRVGSDLEVSV